MKMPKYQTKLDTVLPELSLLCLHFINTTAHHSGRYDPTPPPTKELHATSISAAQSSVAAAKLVL